MTERGGLTRPLRHSEAVRIPSRCTRLLRGQHRFDLRPTASNLMDDESLEEGLDGLSFRYLCLRYRYYF